MKNRPRKKKKKLKFPVKGKRMYRTEASIKKGMLEIGLEPMTI
jgi:hypothetical protein